MEEKVCDPSALRCPCQSEMGKRKGENLLCISIITNALLLASTTIFFLCPWHGIVYVPVLVVGSLAERVRSQIPVVDRIQLSHSKLS